MRLLDKTAIVTGAGSRDGIGRAIALGLAAEGANVAIGDLDGEGAARTAAEVERLGRRALAIQVDMADATQVERLIDSAVAAFGGIDILVNNAGFCAFVPFLEISEELWDRTMAVNVKGYFLAGQQAARVMARQGRGGRIVNISSQCAEHAGQEKTHYCASKAAVKLLTKGMALELASYGINVNAVAPGTIDTGIVREDRIKRLVEAERRESTIPWGRMGRAEDVVGAVIFLACAESAYCTGAEILVDGGSTAGSLLPRRFRAPSKV
jgi:NAD(P)-dependent dehydrogenase (short-subunit alcohol dehydrogenase family)